MIGYATLESDHPTGILLAQRLHSTDDLARLLAGLRTLAQFEVVRGIHIGLPASTEVQNVVDNSYSVSDLLFLTT